MRNHVEKDPKILELLKEYGGNPNNIPTSVLIKERLSVVLSHDQFYLLHSGKIGWKNPNTMGAQSNPTHTKKVGETPEKSLADEIVDLPEGAVLGGKE